MFLVFPVAHHDGLDTAAEESWHHAPWAPEGGGGTADGRVGPWWELEMNVPGRIFGASIGSIDILAEYCSEG